jgi:hypothetical protein
MMVWEQGKSFSKQESQSGKNVELLRAAAAANSTQDSTTSVGVVVLLGMGAATMLLAPTHVDLSASTYTPHSHIAAAAAARLPPPPREDSSCMVQFHTQRAKPFYFTRLCVWFLLRQNSSNAEECRGVS